MIQELASLKDKLLILKKELTNNRIDYMQWEKYPEQNNMRVAILDRVKKNSGDNIFVVFGGNRSGKSELGGGVVSEVFRDLENKRIWCATLSDISIKVQQRKIKDMIRQKDIKYGEYNQVRGWKNKTIISHKNTVIYFKTYEQGAESFQGDDIDIAWFDEECPYDVFQETLIRLGDRKGIMLMTFTSLQGYTRLVNRLWEANDAGIKTTVLTPYMNPFLDDAVKEQLKSSIDPDDVESRWEGKPHVKEGLIYKEFGETHKIDRFDYTELVYQNPGRWKVYEGIDPHERTPHHWLRFLYDKSNDILYIVEELKAYKECMLIEDFARLIKEKRGKKYKSREMLVPEYTQIDTSSMKPTLIKVHQNETQIDNVTVRTEFNKCGIHTILCIKDNALGINSVKERLKIIKGKDGELKKKPRLYVFRDCTGTIWEFQRYAWEAYRNTALSEGKELINEPKKKDDHYMDVLKYQCIKLRLEEGENYVYKETKPMYNDMGY